MRYRIDQVKTWYETMNDVINIEILYTDMQKTSYNKDGVYIQLALSTLDAYSTSDAAITDMICKKAAQEVSSPYEFYDAMRYYMKDMEYNGKSLFGNPKPKPYSPIPWETPVNKYGYLLIGDSISGSPIYWEQADKIVESANMKPIKKSGSSSDFVHQIDLLPGLNARVKHPVTKEEAPIKDIIINLNDYHKWTREAIADWLETLDVDLRFKSKDDILREK